MQCKCGAVCGGDVFRTYLSSFYHLYPHYRVIKTVKSYKCQLMHTEPGKKEGQVAPWPRQRRKAWRGQRELAGGILSFYSCMELVFSYPSSQQRQSG